VVPLCLSQPMATLQVVTARSRDVAKSPPLALKGLDAYKGRSTEVQWRRVEGDQQ
jgi:hypothetical protein